MFHYIFPPLTIGMGVVMVYLEGRYLWTKDPLYESATKFWTQLFVGWVHVLHGKIQKGPEPAEMPERTTEGGVLSAGSDRIAHNRSMTGAKDRPEGEESS